MGAQNSWPLYLREASQGKAGMLGESRDSAVPEMCLLRKEPRSPSQMRHGTVRPSLPASRRLDMLHAIRTKLALGGRQRDSRVAIRAIVNQLDTKISGITRRNLLTAVPRCSSISRTSLEIGYIMRCIMFYSPSFRRTGSGAPQKTRVQVPLMALSTVRPEDPNRPRGEP